MDIATQYLNIGYLDNLSFQRSFVHRIDARVKLIVSAIFVLCVVSFPKYSLSGLIPFFVYPAFLIVNGDIPAGYILKKVAIISPFAILIGIFNPFIDREVVLSVAGISISGGWISFMSIILKFILTVSTALLLIATTSFAGICEAMRRLRLPEAFVVQLYFLYRYLFVLLEETYRIVRAREARSFGKRGYGFRPFINLLSGLLMRTLQRADRIYGAMQARGYSGKMAVTARFSIRSIDIFFGISFAIIFIFFRLFNVALFIENILMRNVL